MELERQDPLKASTISFNIVQFQTSRTAPIEDAPRRFFIQIRFFTFPEVQTDTISVVSPFGSGDLTLVPGETYPLAKEQLIQHMSGKVERQVTTDSSVDKNAL